MSWIIKNSLLAHDRKGKWSQLPKDLQSSPLSPFQIHPVCTVPCPALLSVIRQAKLCPSTPEPLHILALFLECSFLTSRLFLLPESVYASPPQRRSHPSSVHSYLAHFLIYSHPLSLFHFIICFFLCLFPHYSMSFMMTTKYGTPGPRTRPGPGQVGTHFNLLFFLLKKWMNTWSLWPMRADGPVGLRMH